MWFLPWCRLAFGSSLDEAAALLAAHKPLSASIVLERDDSVVGDPRKSYLLGGAYYDILLYSAARFYYEQALTGTLQADESERARRRIRTIDAFYSGDVSPPLWTFPRVTKLRRLTQACRVRLSSFAIRRVQAFAVRQTKAVGAEIPRGWASWQARRPTHVAAEVYSWITATTTASPPTIRLVLLQREAHIVSIQTHQDWVLVVAPVLTPLIGGWLAEAAGEADSALVAAAEAYATGMDAEVGGAQQALGRCAERE